MPAVNKRLGLDVQRAFTRRAALDSSDIRVHASGGTVYLAGRIKLNRGAVGVDMRKELEIVERCIRTIPGVRDIVNEIALP